MNINIIKYVVNVGLIIVFFAISVTGLVKFPGLVQYIGMNRGSLPMYEINLIHEWSGVVMVLLVLIHFILNIKWMIVMTKKLLRHDKWKE
ncbi:MAG: DUF4405 domain-containing protein [Candidatus Aenigmatarchaeota archaeon]